MQKQHFLLLLIASFALAQSPADSLYREDQIYASMGYPLLIDTPEGLTQNKLSHTFSFGFIRDMPINSARNLAFGLGLGLNYNVVYTNLQFTDDMKSTTFVSSDVTNQWNSVDVEIPLEFRWRNSTAMNYQFWRIYGGVVGYYPLSAKQRTRTALTESITSLSVQNFRLALRLNVGNNTWNLTYTHPIDSFFDFDKSTHNKSLSQLKTAKLGLIFYIF
ncbi:MAG: outer membrane beta-barrel protein [Flavobacteriaceae bacterium]